MILGVRDVHRFELDLMCPGSVLYLWIEELFNVINKLIRKPHYPLQN